jgi:hypothetical protein
VGGEVGEGGFVAEGLHGGSMGAVFDRVKAAGCTDG